MAVGNTGGPSNAFVQFPEGLPCASASKCSTSWFSHAGGVRLCAGEYLDEAADTTCTWISPDGGVTWNDVLPTSAIYEVHWLDAIET